MTTLSIVLSRAQGPPRFVEKLTIEEGLGSNKVNDVIQDDHGFLWIATSDGLNRYDGTEVVKFYHHMDRNSIPHNYVYCLKKLPGNYLAIGTQAGLSFYDGATGKFNNFYWQQSTGLDEYNNIITQLELDDRGNLWAMSRNGVFIFDRDRKLKKSIISGFTEAELIKSRQKFVSKIWTISGGNGLFYMHNGWQVCMSGTYQLLPLRQSAFRHRLSFIENECRPGEKMRNDYFPVAGLFRVLEKYFLFISRCADSLFLYDDNGARISSIAYPYNRYPYTSWSQKVSTLDSSKLLIAHHNFGYSVLPLNWLQGRPVLGPVGPSLLETFEYGNALQDTQGNWWLATVEQGMQKISPFKQFISGETLLSGLDGSPIKYDINFISRYKDQLLITTYGEGIYIRDLKSGSLQHHDLSKLTGNRWSNFIWNIRHHAGDSFWVGSQAGLYWYQPGSRRSGPVKGIPGIPRILDSVAITTQYVDSRGWIWMGLGRGNGVCYFDPQKRIFKWFRGNDPQGYPERYPLDIDEDENGDLWFSNDASSTIVQWDASKAEFKSWPLPVSARNISGSLHALEYGSNSRLWLGSVTGGLLLYDLKDRSVKIFGHDRGLVNSHISKIHQDEKGRLWLVTDGSLSCFDPVTELFTNYTTQDGLPVVYPTGSFYFDQPSGRLYNGGKSKYFHFDPDSLYVSHPPQTPMITMMMVNGVSYPLDGQKVRLSHNENNITIHYSAVDLVNGAGTRYAYKLVGEDTGWNLVGNQRQINFSHLAPGSYDFSVRAATSNGVWSDAVANIHFTISQKFTKTGLFYGLLVAGMGIVFYGLYRFRLRQIKQSEKIRDEISQNLHDEVGSALTNISLSSLLAQKQVEKDSSVSRVLDRIYQDSQQVSEAMREIVWSINPRIDTVGEALPRMLRYASEMLENNGIELKAEMDPSIEHVKLSMKRRRDLYLIFKEAVNNLARHSRATQVTIRFQLKGKTLVMVVQDNGTGFDLKHRQDSNGLRNMRSRADHHRWDLDILSEQGAGTTLVLKAQIA